MSEAKLVWQVIRDASKDFWLRIENYIQPGTPDTTFIFNDHRTGFAELKYKTHWPKREDTKTDLGLSPEQFLMLPKMWDAGGRVYLIARVGDEWLVVRGRDIGRFTKNQWRSISIFQGEFDYKRIKAVL